MSKFPEGLFDVPNPSGDISGIQFVCFVPQQG
jgi:hypothetical protein